jgi:aquaporin Z
MRPASPFISLDVQIRVLQDSVSVFPDIEIANILPRQNNALKTSRVSVCTQTQVQTMRPSIKYAGGNMKKYFAELVGTFILVLFGCGTAVVAGDKVGILGIAFAFGLSLVGAAYGIGTISGCHINPAVSLGVFVAGRMSVKDMIGYWVGQCLGAILAAYVLYAIVAGVGGGYNLAANGLGQDGWGPGYQGGYGLHSAILFELVATMIFVIVILGSTQAKAPTGFAGLAIGITLVVIHIFGIHITGVSVNPARSLGPALIVGGQAMAQLWLFLLVPSVGGAIAGLLFRFKALEAD